MHFLLFALASVEAWTSRTRFLRHCVARSGVCMSRRVASIPSFSRGDTSIRFSRPPSCLSIKDQWVLRMSSDWGSFVALDDDDDSGRIDRTDYAREEDTQERKAMVGVSLEPPTILQPVDPISVPAGTKTEIVSRHEQRQAAVPRFDPCLLTLILYFFQ
jgi:hypothetical protein